MYAALRRAAPLRRRAVSALASAVLQQQPAALLGAVAPRLPAPAAASAAATAAWFHSSPAWLGFREMGPAGAAARAEFAPAEEGPFYEEEKRAPGGAAEEGLEIAKLGISSKIVDRLAKKGITKLFPIQEHRDPFELVADDLSLVADRLRSMVAAEVPKLASAAEYFFKVGAEGKKFRPTVLLLMASALKFPLSESTDGVLSILADKLHAPQLNIAEITEMIHVASLLHDDVLDDADTRRGVSSLNLVMGNKLSVLAGDFLLSRACVTLAALGNTEVVSLMATAVEHLVTGETMQISTSREQQRSMEYYLQKTYYKTASLISNSCKAVAVLAGHTAEVSMLAYEYGRNLGLAFQLIDDVLDFTGTAASLGKGSLSDIRHGIITAPILYAMEEFPQLNEVVDRGFDDPANVELALDYLRKSRGIERTKELAREHANHAIKAIEALPDSDDEDVLTSRRALIDITERVITRTK